MCTGGALSVYSWGHILRGQTSTDAEYYSSVCIYYKKSEESEKGSMKGRHEDAVSLKLLPFVLWGGGIVPLWKTWESWSSGHFLECLFHFAAQALWNCQLPLETGKILFEVVPSRLLGFEASDPFSSSQYLPDTLMVLTQIHGHVKKTIYFNIKHIIKN